MNTKVKLISHAKAQLRAAILLPVLLLSGVTSQAAVLETQPKDWGKGPNVVCCDADFEARYGNNKLNKDWELQSEGAATPAAAPVIVTDQHTYESGVSQSFSLSHSALTGDLIFTIGDSEPMVIDMPGPDVDAPKGYGWETIGFLIKTNGKKDIVASLDNLLLTSVDTGSVAINDIDGDGFGDALVTGEKKNKTKAIILKEDYTTFFYDFTITGDLTFSWKGKKGPKKNDLQFMIGVADQVPVPVPAAAWLFGSALGFLGWQHRRQMS